MRVQFHVEAAEAGALGVGARGLYARHLRQEAAQRSAGLSAAARTRLAQAEHDRDYLREACALDELNAHCYRLRAHKREPEPGSVRLYVRAAGLTVAPESRPPASFPWPCIGKLSFDRKKFEIRAGESRITLYSSEDEKSKLLLTLCRETHRFSMKAAVECPDPWRGTLPRDGDKSEQRISVISSASSNTTSGIVSDRVHSEDEPEIMIDAPPTLTEDPPEALITPDVSETSGVYTMASSAAVLRSEDGSAHYGQTGQPTRASVASDCASFYNDGSYVSGDSVDGVPAFRDRADSGASGTGSFRGDGSDPTDRQHGPLSAEELSDLIVGRADYPPPPPAPADSESDYMTLLRPTGPSYLAGHEDTAPSEDGYPDSDRPYSPPPPVPPKRFDSAKGHLLSLPSIVDAVDAVDGSFLHSLSTRVRPPPPYEADHRLPQEPVPFSDQEISTSLRELRLGIPIREPPPYPGRACPARFPASSLLRTQSTIGPEGIRAVPPPPLTVYTSQLARSQIEQYRRQLYSDVDYVVYPLQDPAISHQDYLDSKLAAACPRGAMCRGGSTQALSDTYVRLPPCVTPPRREPPPPPFGRTMSDDNILNSLGSAPRSRRLPPPPPPYPRRPPPREPPAIRVPEPRPKDPPRLTPDPPGPIDIKTLREKSKNLDLPLIAALCNDKSLLKQTKAFVMPRHGTAGVGVGRAAGLGTGKERRGCHRHPGDALPALPLPSPRATANTYVPDPHPRPPAVA